MKVNILPEVYKKIMFFVDISDIEVSMMGKVTKEGSSFTLRSVHLADQLNHGTETEMQPESLGKLLYETREEEGELNCWIHSHVNMGVSRSGTDVKTGLEMGANGYCLAMIFNKSRKSNCVYYQGETEFLPSLVIEDIKVTIQNELYEDEVSEWEAEFKKKCKPKPVAKPKPVSKPAHNSTVYHGKGINSGKIWDNVARVWKDKEPVPTLVPPTKDGAIHKTNHKLRWCDKSMRWIDYTPYWMNHHADEYMDNVIDIIGVREDTIHSYLQQYAMLPENDYIVDEYYMEMNDMSALDYYVDALEDTEGYDDSLPIQG